MEGDEGGERAEEREKDADGALSLRRQKGIERGGQQFFGQAGCYLWGDCGRRRGRRKRAEWAEEGEKTRMGCYL